jgi:two-component system, OmpR family, KDP operon response regulator KdpE
MPARHEWRRGRGGGAVPIIVVSARVQEEDKVAALDEGANDYVTKPFVVGELLARIRVALRTTGQPAASPESGTMTVGDLAVDFDMRRVTVGGREVHLTPIEYRLIGVMIRSAGRVLSHGQILRQVWGPLYDDQMGYLRVYMKKLRYKIEPEPAQPKYLVNEIGVGYRLRVPS